MNRDICLRIDGALLERLLQRALEGGAVLTRIRRISARRIIVETDARSAGILIALCEKYALKHRLLRSGGSAACARFIRRRWTLLLGTALCILLCSLFLSRLWQIDVRLTEGRINPTLQVRVLNLLKAQNVQSGTPIQQIEPSRLQRNLSAALEDVSYVGIRRQGVRLLVELSPEAPAPQLYQQHSARDLFASQNAVINSIRVYSGEACVRVGDTVLRGDILIRGEEAISKEDTAPIGARGEVSARCWFEGSAETSLRQSVSSRTGRAQHSRFLRLGRWFLPLSPAARYPSEEIERKITPVGALFLPLTQEDEIHYETTPLMKSADREALAKRLRVLACADALRQIQTACGNEYKIASIWTDAQIHEGTLRIRAVYEIYTDIAVTRDALIEEVY